MPLSQDQLDALRASYPKILETYPEGITNKCADFIDKLVAGITGKPYNSRKDLLTDFDRIRNGTGGFYWESKSWRGGAQGGLLARNNAWVTLNRSQAFDSTNKNQTLRAAFGFLHEIIHAVTAKDDKDISSKIRDLGFRPTYYPGSEMSFPTDADNRNLAYSGYFEQALINNCGQYGR